MELKRKEVEELMEADKSHFLHPTSSIQDHHKNGPAIIIENGENIYLTDINGKKYIEGMSSLWNVNIGYGRKELAEVAHNQIKKLNFSSTFSTYSHKSVIKLAKKIAEISPGNLNTTFFTSGGSEANDSAIKIARYYWRLKGFKQKKKIIARYRGYHGVSLGATSATGIKEFWEMASNLEDFVHVDPMSTKALIEKIEQVGSENIAAFIAEPIIGAGGILIPNDNYFKEVREICDKYDILFIADEVITGFGRTGKMFGLEHWDVVPDIMTIAKGINSGYIPLGGVVITDAVKETLTEKSIGTMFHGFTYSGHPVACEVSLKNIEIIEDEGLIENARMMGQFMVNQLKDLEGKVGIIGDIRAKGLLVAFEFYEDPQNKKRFTKKIAPEIVKICLDQGLICRSVTYEDADTLALAPPLIINKLQVTELMEKLEKSIKTYLKINGK